MLRQHLLCSVCAHCPLSWRWGPLRRALLCLLYTPLQFRAAELQPKHVACKRKRNQANQILVRELNPHVHPFYTQQDAAQIRPPPAVASFKSVQRPFN